MSLQKPRGTRDFSPEEMSDRDYVAGKIEDLFKAFGYRKIITPTFEHVELFQMKSGEEITEHMYVFEDKSGRRLCLRPEATASVCRMFAEELRSRRMPLRLYYYSPMFRYERPQKGRYREFWQLGVELLGAETPESDAEVIQLAYESLKSLGIGFRLEVGHIGILRGLMSDLGVDEGIQDKATALIDKGDMDALKKLVDEPILLELIAMKGVGAIDEAEHLLQRYATAYKALNELKQITGYLDLLNIEYMPNLGIARGLEYYTGMVFEVRVMDLAAQNQICGGGRYDNLIQLFSGIKVPAVGFAFGFDRIMDALRLQGVTLPKEKVDVVVAPVSDKVRKEAIKISSLLRPQLKVEYDVMRRRLEKILEYASDIGSRFVLIVGEEDLKKGEVTLRNMNDGSQRNISLNGLKEELMSLCR